MPAGRDVHGLTAGVLFVVAEGCLAIAAWLGRAEWAARSRGAAFVSMMKTADSKDRNGFAFTGRLRIGQVALVAGERGLKVTGVDIATNLILAARGRAAGLDVQFDEGDAEALPNP